MSEEQEFFKTIEEMPAFADSDYNIEDVPKSTLERSILVSFLTRHHIPLSLEDTKESIKSKQWIEATEKAVDESVQNLVQDGFLKQQNSKYTLDRTNEIVEVVQDARIEYVINKEY